MNIRGTYLISIFRVVDQFMLHLEVERRQLRHHFY